MPMIDETGHVYGRLTVVESAGIISRYTCWRCQCSCGQICVVRGSSLRAHPGTKSCGCLNRDTARQQMTRHGESSRMVRSREYRAWQEMKSRCGNENRRYWSDYGGRGITVCDRWCHSFQDFLADMGRCPAGYWLDRINNDGSYHKDNCRWATPRKQLLNRRGCRYWTVDGERIGIAQMAQWLAISEDVLGKRLRKMERSL